VDYLGVTLNWSASQRRIEVGTHALEALGPDHVNDRVTDDLFTRRSEPLGVSLTHPQIAHVRAALGHGDGQRMQDFLRASKGIRGGLGIAHDA